MTPLRSTRSPLGLLGSVGPQTRYCSRYPSWAITLATSSATPSVRHRAAAHVERLPGDASRLVRHEEHRHRSDLARVDQSLLRAVLDDVGQVFLSLFPEHLPALLHRLPHHLRIHVPWAHRVDGDAE